MNRPLQTYLCEHRPPEGIFAMVGGSSVRIQIDYRRKVDEATAEALCIAAGSDWLFSYHWENFWLRQCRCGQWFIAHSHARRHCSEACAALKAAERQSAARAISKTKRAEKVAAAKCEMCGVKIEAKRISKQFCSAKCRQKAVRKWYS